MGKAALILALAVSITFAFANMSREESRINTSLADSDYKDEVVSRQAAQSAYNIVVSQVEADFDKYRGSVSDKAFSSTGSNYEYSAVSGSNDNEVIVTAKGMLNNHEFEITGIVRRLKDLMLDSMTIDADIKETKNKYEVEIGNKTLISGHDINPDGSVGPGNSVFAILTPTEQTYKSVKTGTGSSKIIGKQPKENPSENKSMEIDAPQKNLTEFAEEIEAYVGAGLIDLAGNQTWDKKTTIGTSANPVVVRVDGNVEIKNDAIGYGILYVRGNFKMKDNAKWYGIVYQYYDGGSFETEGFAQIYGATIARSMTVGGDGMIFKVKGNSLIQYSSAILRQMNIHLQEFEPDTDGFEDARILETPVRVGRVRALRDKYALSRDEYLQQESHYSEQLKKTTVDLRSTYNPTQK